MKLYTKSFSSSKLPGILKHFFNKLPSTAALYYLRTEIFILWLQFTQLVGKQLSQTKKFIKHRITKGDQNKYKIVGKSLALGIIFILLFIYIVCI